MEVVAPPGRGGHFSPIPERLASWDGDDRDFVTITIRENDNGELEVIEDPNTGENDNENSEDSTEWIYEPSNTNDSDDNAEWPQASEPPDDWVRYIIDDEDDTLSWIDWRSFASVSDLLSGLVSAASTRLNSGVQSRAEPASGEGSPVGSLRAEYGDEEEREEEVVTSPPPTGLGILFVPEQYRDRNGNNGNQGDGNGDVKRENQDRW